MKKYSVEVVYTATVTYSNEFEVEAKDEGDAEDKALALAQASGLSGWTSDEDSGDFEVQSVDEIEETEENV